MGLTEAELARARANDAALAAYVAARHDCARLRRAIRELEDTARSVGAAHTDGVRVRSSAGGDVVGALAVALAAAEDRYRARLLESLAVMERVERIIAEAALAASDRRLLELRYIDGLSYSAIADAAGYAEPTTARRRVWILLSRLELTGNTASSPGGCGRT